MVTRTQITDTAHSFLGTRWQHMGRSRAGVDCIGLLVAVADALECTPPDLYIPPYNRQPDGTLLEYFRKYMTKVPKHRLQPGTAVVFSFLGSPYHAGIVIDPERGSIIHAYAAKRKVVYDTIDNTQKGRKLIAAWDFPGVTNG